MHQSQALDVCVCVWWGEGWGRVGGFTAQYDNTVGGFQMPVGSLKP